MTIFSRPSPPPKSHSDYKENVLGYDLKNILFLFKVRVFNQFGVIHFKGSGLAKPAWSGGGVPERQGEWSERRCSRVCVG